jgi:predicted MFS family arabinose efflux permease
MIAFGFGEVLGGWITGIVIDKYGCKTASIKNVFLTALMTSVTLFCINVNKYSITTFIMCFVWGYMDGSLNIHCHSIMGF